MNDFTIMKSFPLILNDMNWMSDFEDFSSVLFGKTPPQLCVILQIQIATRFEHVFLIFLPLPSTDNNFVVTFYHIIFIFHSEMTQNQYK